MRVRAGASAPTGTRAGLINPPAAVPARARRWAGTAVVRRAALAVGIARLSRLEEGIWWDRWRHRGAAPTREGVDRVRTLNHH